MSVSNYPLSFCHNSCFACLKITKAILCPSQAFSAYFYTFDFLGLAPKAPLTRVVSTIETHCNKNWTTVSPQILLQYIIILHFIVKSLVRWEVIKCLVYLIMLILKFMVVIPFYSLLLKIQPLRQNICKIIVLLLIILWLFCWKDTSSMTPGIKSLLRNG